jgi:hypothetical protein
MSPRLRLAAAVLVLSGALIFSLLGVVSSGASVRASGRVSAHLTTTSLKAAQAGQVKLIYKFSSKSKRFGYVLSRKMGAKWLNVRSVNTRGRFSGSHTMTVKQIFGPKPIKVGQYRVKVSADANSVTLRFAVITSSSNNPSTPPPSSPSPTAPVKPEAGRWHSASLSGPTSGGEVTVWHLEFQVLPDGATVSQFTFGFDYSGVPRPGESCSGRSVSAINANATSPIADGRFSSPGTTGAWSGAGAGSFEGTFDSPTSAHGTAQFGVPGIGGPGCFVPAHGNTGTFSWTATSAPETECPSMEVGVPC